MKWKTETSKDANYYENSSIHGVKYISHKKSRSVLARLLWGVILLVSFFCCGYLIARVYQKRCESPVIVSFSELPTPVWQIPFPAVTICLETKTRRGVFRYTETYLKIKENNLTQIELEQFNVVYQLCLNKLNVTSNYDGSKYIEVLKNLAPLFNETFHYCSFLDEKNDCNKLHSPIFTDAGLCYTFNGLSGEEIYRTSELSEDFLLNRSKNATLNWNNQDGYLNDDIDTYPNRGFDASRKYGYVTLLKLFEEDFDYVCRGSTQGFQVVVHNPADHPNFCEEHHKVQLGSEISIKIHPRMIKTTPTLISVPPEKRGCFFAHERYLRFFKIYTKPNCDIECIANYTVCKCGCAKFHMPRNETTRICNANDIKCYQLAEYNIISKEIEQKLEDDSESPDHNCNCMPVCNSLEYDADVTDVRFNFKEFLDARKLPRNLSTTLQYAKINVFFKTPGFISKKRSELYTNTDVLANAGGLIGMFLGASLLSIVEVFYFCVLRFINLLRKNPESHVKNGGGVTLVTPAV